MTTLPDRYRAAAEAATEPCNFCKRPIVWAATKESRIPLDAKPDTTGNVLVTTIGDTLTATVLGTASRRSAYVSQGFALYAIHKLSCPKAAEWSRPKTAKKTKAKSGTAKRAAPRARARPR